MRVVQVNFAADPALSSAAALLERYDTLVGWAAAIAAAGAEVLTVQQFQTSSNVTRAGLPFTFGTFNEIAEAAVRFQPDVVHVNGLANAGRTWILRRWCRAPPRSVSRVAAWHPPALVVQDHGNSPPPGVRALVRRPLFAVVDAFLFSTEAQATPWRDAALLSARQPVHAVMEASTSVRAAPREQARAASGVDGDPAIVWVGRLNANKDPLVVLDAFERYAAQRAAATLTLLFQGGELVERVRARVATSPLLRDRVRLVGEQPHDRVPAFLSAADLFVLGSHHEGSGYALMEAIACGATPVVTDIPSFRALAGDVGRFWTPGDADACARALASAAAMRDRARVIDWFERRLTWEAVGKRAVAIYEEVVRAKGKGQRA